MAYRNRLSISVETPRPRVRKKPEHRETRFHIDAFAFLKLILPRNSFVFHPANGGKRGKAEGAIFKAMGVVAGVPDFVIVWDRRVFFLELKTVDGELSIEQRATIASIEMTGAPVETVRTFEEIRDRLGEMGIPLRRAVRFGNEYREAA